MNYRYRERVDSVGDEEQNRFVGLARDKKWEEFREKLIENPGLLWISFDALRRSAAYWAVFHNNFEMLELMLETISRIENHHERIMAVEWVFNSTDTRGKKPENTPFFNETWTGDSARLREFYHRVKLLSDSTGQKILNR